MYTVRRARWKPLGSLELTGGGNFSSKLTLFVCILPVTFLVFSFAAVAMCVAILLLLMLLLMLLLLMMVATAAEAILCAFSVPVMATD